MMNWMAIYPELALLAMACVVMLADLFCNKHDHRVAYGLTLLTLLGLGGLCGVYLLAGVDVMAMQRMVIADPLAMLLKGLAALATAVSLVYGRRYSIERGIWGGELFSLSLFALLGQFVMISAANLLAVYLGLELLSLSLYALVGLRRDNALATEAAMKYFVLGALASGFLLYGMSLIYGATGSLDLAVVFRTVATQPVDHAVLVLGVVFLVAGVAFKLGAAPFHMWIPDVYQGAPTAVVLLVGAAPKLAALALALRLLVQGLFPLAPDWQQMLMVAAIASLVVGNFAAIAQTNLKRMLAYSTIAQIGFVLLALMSGMINGTGVAAAVSYGAAAFYMISYVLTTLGTFGVILFLSGQGFEAEEISDFAGLAKTHPWLAAIMTFLMFSLAGLPPFVGFYAKFEVLSVLLATGRIWLVVTAVLLSVVGAFYYLRMVKTMYFDAPTVQHKASASGLAWGLMSVNGLAILVLGLLPSGLMTLCYQAVASSLH